MNFEHLTRYEITMIVAQTFWDMFLIILLSFAISVVFAWVMALVKQTSE